MTHFASELGFTRSTMVCMETPPHLATPDQPWMQKCWVICSWRGRSRSCLRSFSSRGFSTRPETWRLVIGEVGFV